MDCGEDELAFKIADTALKIFAKETDASYCCFEHFMSANGRGSGFPQFSGLSTPVLMFFASYYTPGTLTVGFETMVADKSWNAEKTSLTFRASCGGKAPTALICLKAGENYTFTVNGQPVSAKKVTDGAYALALVRGENTVSVSEIKE